MTLLSPLALLGLLALPLVVVFYLFRPQPRRRKSTTYFLWKAAAPDSQGGSFAKRLQQNPLLWLQLLIVLLLILFLARPSLPWRTTATRDGRVIVVIDRSASMNSADAFSLAKQEATKAVNQMLGFRLSGNNPEVMLLAVDSSPQVVVPFTKDRESLLSAIDQLPLTDVPDQLSGMAGFLRSLIKTHKARVWIFGDHLPEELRLPGVQFTSCATTMTPNVGVVSFSVRQPDPTRGQKKPFLYCRLENFSETALQRVVRLEKMQPDNPAAVEALVMERSLLLAAKSGRTLSEPIPAARLEAARSSIFRLTVSPPSGEPEESFQSDDRSYSVAPPYLSDKVLVAHTKGLNTPFLLRAIASYSSIKVVSTDQLVNQPDPPVVDLLLTPNEASVPANIKFRSRFLVSPGAPSKDAPVGRLVVAQQSAPLVAQTGVEWTRLKVQVTDDTALQSDETVLLKTARGPALTLKGVSQGLPTLHWRFPLSHSSLPLSPALPIVVGRFIDQYSRATSVPTNGSVTTSHAMRRPVGGAWQGVLDLEPLVGNALELDQVEAVSKESESLPLLRRTGVYKLKVKDSELSESLAVNLFSVSESSLPQDTEDLFFPLEDDTVEVESLSSSEEIQYRNVGLPFLLLAFIIVLLEAGVFLKRGRP